MASAIQVGGKGSGGISVRVTLTGLTELNKKLRALPGKTRRAYERKIIRSGNAVIRKAARAAWKAAVPGTRTAKDIISKVVTLGRGERKTVVGITGPVIPSGFPETKGKHKGRPKIANRMLWKEFGVPPRRWKTLSGKSTGAIRARPWFRPAWEASKDKIERMMLERGWAEIQKAATAKV